LHAAAWPSGGDAKVHAQLMFHQSPAVQLHALRKLRELCRAGKLPKRYVQGRYADQLVLLLGSADSRLQVSTGKICAPGYLRCLLYCSLLVCGYVRTQLACARLLARLPGSELVQLVSYGIISVMLSLLCAGSNSEAAAAVTAVVVLVRMSEHSVELRAELLHAGALSSLRELAQQSTASAALRNAVVLLQDDEPFLLIKDPVAQACARLLSSNARLHLKALMGLRQQLSVSHNPPIQQVLDTPGVLDKLVHFLHTAQDAALLVSIHSPTHGQRVRSTNFYRLCA